MKSTKTKTPVAQPKKESSFFAKGNDNTFFRSSRTSPSFFRAGHLRPPTIQPKLSVGKPNDKYEREADDMADKVVQRLAAPERVTPADPSIQMKPCAPPVQLKCAECEREEQRKEKEKEDQSLLQRRPIFESNAEDILQTKCSHCQQEEAQIQRVGDSEPAAPSSVEERLNASKGSGSPLPESVNESMSNTFGSDFSNVRIHNDSAAASLSKDLSAQAFTYGSDIYFNAGKYDTSSTAGKHLLAHELTHTIQQGSDVRPRRVEKKIQRVSLYYWEPPRYNGTQEHKFILNDITTQHGDYIIEGPMPNAQRDKLGKGAAAGYGKKGSADLYRGLAKSGTNTIIGIYFFDQGKPSNLGRRGTKQSGKPFTGPAAPVYKAVNKVDDVDKAPENIFIGDLKPINSLESSYGKEQLDAYKEGIEKYAAVEVNKLSPTDRWNPDVTKLSESELDRIVPPRYTKNATNPLTETSVLKGDRAGKHVRVKTKLVAVADKATHGIMSYAWVPVESVSLDTIPSKIRDLGKEVTDFIIDPLKAPEVKHKTTGGKLGKKAIPGTTHQPPTEVTRSSDRNIQRVPQKEFDLKKWNADKKRITQEYKKVKTSSEIGKVEEVEKRMQADQLLQKHLGIARPTYSKPQLEAISELKKVKFWSNPLTSIFGTFKKLMGSAYNVFASGFTKLKGWIQGIARKLQFKSTSGGLVGSAIKAVFNLLKVIARATISTVVELLKQDIVNGVRKKIESLVGEMNLEENIAYIKSAIAPVQDTITKFENWVTGAIEKYKTYFDTINEVIKTLSFINDIISKVRWAARAIACVSPPLVGCLWMLAQAALEKAASYVVETCWFRTKISPWVLKLNYVRSLGQELYKLLKGQLKGFLPPVVQELFVDSDENKSVPVPGEDEIKCQPGEGGGGGGGGEITPEQEEVMKLQEQLGEEKFNALLELIQKAKIDGSTLMSSEQIKRLGQAVQNMSAEDIKKMAESYVKGNTKSVPEDIKKAVEALKSAPKGPKGPEPVFDAAAKEKEVEAAEARKDAAEAYEEGEAPSEEITAATGAPAKYLMSLILNAQNKKDQIIVEQKGKVIVNNSLIEKLKKSGVQIYDLKITAEFLDFTVNIQDTVADNTPVQQISITIELRVTNSDNPSIAPGSTDKFSHHVLWNPAQRSVIVLQKSAVLSDIITGIQKNQPGIEGKVYDFAELGFKAKLTDINISGELAELSFSTTEIVKGTTPAIFDFKTRKYITLTVGRSFMIHQKCSGCDKTPVQKKASENTPEPVVRRQPMTTDSPAEEETLQLKCESCHNEETIQLSSSDHANGRSHTFSRGDLSYSRATSLPGHLNYQLSRAFGTDFSDVKIHTDATAVRLSRELHAQAFTYGNHIYFNEDKFNTGTDQGKHLLAHELTHTIQQGSTRNTVSHSLQKAGTPAAVTDPDKLAQTVYDALDGWTSSADSATIRSQFDGKSKTTTDAIIKGVADRAKESVTYVIEWMESDMVTSDWRAVLSHLVSVKAYLVERAIGYKLYSLLLGYTSEDDSREICSLLMGDTPVTGDLLDSALTQLEGKGEYTRDFASEKLFDDMQPLDAARLATHFFNSGPGAMGYAAHWRAYKIKDLISGFTGINDSRSIVKNFDSVPEKLRLTVWFELEKLCLEAFKKPAATLLMDDMQQEDYEKLRVMLPLLPAYDPTKSFLEWGWDKLVNLGDYVEGALESLLCGVLGVILGILSIVTDLIGAIVDIVVAAKDLLGMIIFYISGGRFCRESKEKVFNFFSGLGKFFDAPGDAVSAMWGEVTGEASAIEGPFAECKQAIFWVKRITNLVVNIILIIAAGYGAIKLALEGLEAIIVVVRSGQLLNALKSIPAKLWKAIKAMPPETAKAIVNNAKAIIKLITNPAKIINGVRNTVSILRLAATDEKFFLFLREQANSALKENLLALKEKELEFWKKRKEFWNKDSAKITADAEAVEAKLVDSANGVTDDAIKAEKTAAEAEKEATNLSKEADDAMDDVVTTGGEGAKPIDNRLPEKWREGMPDRPPKLDPTVTRMRGLGIPEDVIVGIIKNAALAKDYDAALFFGDLNRFIIRFETFVGKDGFDAILRALATEKDFAIARSLMTQVSNGQNITEIMNILSVSDIASLRPRFPGADKNFINDLSKIVSRVSGGRDDIFAVLQDAGDPATLNKALDRLGAGRHSPMKIRESLAFGQQLEKAIATNADAVAKSVWGDAIEVDASGKVVRDAQGRLKFTGKLQPDQASAYIRARREQLADVILKGKGGTAIDDTSWGIIKEVLTKTDLPTIVKNDILGEIWAFTKIRQYENLGYTVIREVAFRILGADGVETGVEARLDAVLKKGNETLYKEFKSSATASTSAGQDKVYDLLNKGATSSLKPYGPNAEKAFGGPGCPEFKAQPVAFDRPPF